MAALPNWGLNSMCQRCGAAAPTRPATFRQNVGALVMRFQSKVEGELCRDCIGEAFVQTTLVTAVIGWLGIISLFAAPIFVVMNVLEYLRGRSVPRPAVKVARPSKPPVSPLVVVSGLLALGGMAIAGLLVVFLVFVGTAERSPAELAFDAANSKLMFYEGQEAFGNTPEAKEAAARFASRLKLVRELAFSKGKEGGVSLSEGHFITHCEIRGSRAAFIVHVPELRRYTTDAQAALARLAWTSARGSLPEGSAVQELAVGLRGVALYDTVMVGRVSDEQGRTSSLVKDLHPFFVDAPASRER